MPDFQQYPAPMVLHQAMVDVVPNADDNDLKFQFAVDGVHAGTESITGAGLSKAGKLLPLRIFPNPSQAGSLIQISIKEGCEMVNCQIMAAPIASHKIVKELSEAQITYKGGVTIEMYFDGVALGSSRYFTSETWKTEKFYMPSGSRGYIFQWKQIENANQNPRGFVGSFETDIIVSDTETPAVPS
tara:strand:- start:1491 stop:2048 length:558 start_codon:yes stop_codon:yes gene_type:complete